MWPTHSLVFEIFFPFFSPPSHQEEKTFFFVDFAQKKFASHSLTKKMTFPKKRSKKVKSAFFRIFAVFVLFFFPKILEQFVVFFFSWKSLHFANSIIFRAEKIQGWKKKTAFLLTHRIYTKKWSKTNFSRGKNTIPFTRVMKNIPIYERHPPWKTHYSKKKTTLW